MYSAQPVTCKTYFIALPLSRLHIMEAAASGLPIVAVNATCIPEIVHDRINGFLIGSGDTDAFSKALISLINNPKMAQTMGKEGCILAKEHAIHHAWQLHEQLYLETIKQTRVAVQRASQLRRKIIKDWIGLK